LSNSYCIILASFHRAPSRARTSACVRRVIRYHINKDRASAKKLHRRIDHGVAHVADAIQQLGGPFKIIRRRGCHDSPPALVNSEHERQRIANLEQTGQHLPRAARWARKTLMLNQLIDHFSFAPFIEGHPRPRQLKRELHVLRNVFRGNITGKWRNEQISNTAPFLLLAIF
jgi:hypothetical protein